jgi:FlaA1/EpsC-like NDP-sugar epimerase
MVQSLSHVSSTTCVTVRFGNVLGSNGSVVLRFLEQIKTGGPVTVTHPEMRRYFMLIPEAVQLVLHAAALCEAGALYTLQMGDQVKLVDMARNLIRLSGFVPEEDIPIEFIGLRPGEKLSEELVTGDEALTCSPIPNILRVQAIREPDAATLAADLACLERAAAVDDAEATLALLSKIVPSFRPGETRGGDVPPLAEPHERPARSVRAPRASPTGSDRIFVDRRSEQGDRRAVRRGGRRLPDLIDLDSAGRSVSVSAVGQGT